MGTHSELSRRLFAGAWFAVAAVIPVAYYFLLLRGDGGPQSGAGLPNFGGSLALTASVPILIAGVCGLLLGSTILDAAETKGAGRAIVMGLAIALLSYLLLFTVSAVLLSFNNDDIVGTIVFLGVLFLYGLVFVGWLVAVVGAAAGGLLYLYRLKVGQNV